MYGVHAIAILTLQSTTPAKCSMCAPKATACALSSSACTFSRLSHRADAPRSITAAHLSYPGNAGVQRLAADFIISKLA